MGDKDRRPLLADLDQTGSSSLMNVIKRRFNNIDLRIQIEAKALQLRIPNHAVGRRGVLGRREAGFQKRKQRFCNHGIVDTCFFQQMDRGAKRIFRQCSLLVIHDLRKRKIVIRRGHFISHRTIISASSGEAQIFKVEKEL